jgi:spermidine dehydrogenase
VTRLTDITRRDFLNGVALSVAAGGTLSPLELLGKEPHRYPPALMGLRGSHAGSFEVAHSLARSGRTWPRPSALTDDEYDLVVVGGGISGLAAAFLFRQKAGPDARILVLDNHDDFGGHAKRNEFNVDGTHIIGYGGSMTIDQPSTYSAPAAQLLRDVGIEVDRFYEYFDQDFFASHGHRRGVYFSAERYGRDSVHPEVFRAYERALKPDWREVLNAYPLSDQGKASFTALLDDPPDFLPGKTSGEKIKLMRRISYSDYLREYAGAHEDVVLFLRDQLRGLWGFGFDALSALEGARYYMPGTWHMWPLVGEDHDSEPYIHHFPDGNAGVARALVGRLVPAALPGPDTMEALAVTPVDYTQLDRRANRTRIRLDSTAVDVRHIDNGAAVDVTYVRSDKAYRVRGGHVILACYNRMIPHLCHELPDDQVEALKVAEKIPLAYINVALRNWQAFARLGYHEFHVPQADFMHSFGMDFPVSMGDYRYARTPDDPVIVHGSFAPTVPDQGMTEREQHIAGGARMLRMSFADYETQIVRQLSGALDGGGFDAERDIAAITVNRWPHGYAYEYNELYDPPEWTPQNGPHLLGARQLGRISIANSDAAAYAYANGAIDAAYRAVNEQT